MKDYSKYYIQGSDHYLIPKDEFENLLKEFEGISNDLETEDKMGKIRKNISIDEAIWKKLQEFAKKENRSASNFIEYLIEKLEKGE